MSAGTGSNTKHLTVFVRLLGEGTPVFRPTNAVLLRPLVAQLLPTDGYDPEDEEWEFKPDSVVRFELRTLDGTDENVATELDSSN